MGLIDWLSGVFGGGSSTVSFGRVDPNSVESYARADHDIDEGERNGPEAHQAALEKWGFANLAAWERAKHVLLQKWATDPTFGQQMATAQHRIHTTAAGYEVPPALAAPVDGVSLEQLATIHARLELVQGQGPAAVAATLGGFGLSPERYERIDAEWKARMGPQADVAALSAAGTLGQLYREYLLHARAAIGRASA